MFNFQHKIKHLVLFVFLCYSTILIAQKPKYYYTNANFNTENGLAGRFTNFTHQDSRGIIWLGTQHGLHRFDGQDFKVFDEEFGLPFNQVMEIYEDDAGWLWLYRSCSGKDKDYCFKDLAFFHLLTHEIKTIEERFGTSIPFILTDIEFIISNSPNREVCIITPDTTYLWTAKNGFYTLPSNQFEKRPRIFTILKDGRLGAFYKNEKEAIYYLLDKTGKTILKQKNLADGSVPIDQIFISDRNILNVIKIGNQKQPKYLRKLDAYKVDSNGTLQLNKPFELMKVFDFNLRGRQTFFDDYTNTFWDAHPGGFKTYSVYPKRFHHVFLDSWVERVYPLNDDEIFYQFGFYNYKTGENILLDEENTIRKVKNPRFDINNFKKANQVLLFKHGWLYLMEDNKTVRTCHASNLFGKAFSQLSSYKKINNVYWLGTDKGLWIYDAEKEALKQFDKVNNFKEFTNSFIHSIAEKGKGEYWITTNKGLFVWSMEQGITAQYSSTQQGRFYIASDNIYHFTQMDDGTLWLATRKGLIHLSTKPNQTIHNDQHYQYFTKKDGLPSSLCVSIYADDYGFLWIGTTKGLVQMQVSTHKMKVYTKKDGLEIDYFFEYSHYKSPDGQLFFGGLKGLTHFHPRDFKDEIFEAANIPLLIIDFEQYNRKTKHFEDKTADILKHKKITLSPNARFFNLRVALKDYRFADMQKYAFRITDYQDEWQESNSNVIKITGLPYGNYVLEVRGRLADGVYSSQILKIPIVVLRPFYLQSWFILLMIVSGLAIIFLQYRRFINRQTVLEKTVQERTAKIRADKKIIENQAEELKTLDKLKSKFFANVSHELRTPLTLILAPLDTVLKRNQLKGRDFSLLSLMKKNGNQLLQLISEILDFSKIEKSKMQLFEKPIAFYPTLNRIVSSFESYAVIQNIDLKLQYNGNTDLAVKLDTNKFERIINNLISNALKFTPQKGTIEVIAIEEKETIKITVKDNGKGIHPDDVPHIFDRYFQTKKPNAATEGGTGIGLALSSEFAKLIGGELSVKSQLGQGSSFILIMPKNETTEPLEIKMNIVEVPQTNEKQHIIIETNSSANETILLVEDNKDLQDYIKLILSDKYNVITADNGVEALQKLSFINCQLIISDVMMPEMDGFQLLEQLKKNENYRRIPTIMLTARAAMKDKLNGLRLGVDDYMTKPFEQEELFARIQNLLKNNAERIKWIQEVEPELEEITINTTTSPYSKEEEQWLKDIELIVNKEFTQFEFNTERFAEKMLLSRSQLLRKLKKLTGLSPTQYIKEARLNQARILLENQTYTSIKAVVYSIGLKHTGRFSVDFKERFGKSPSQYL